MDIRTQKEEAMDFMMEFLETLGTVAFSISGAIEAMKKQMDLLGVLVLGLVTAVGGGVIRDVVTGQIPPVAFSDPGQAKLALSVAVAAFLVGAILVRHPHSGSHLKWNTMLLLSDAIGLAAFTILGIRCVQERMGSSNVALLLFVGVVTGVGGGLMRDIFAGDVPYIFRKHIYATASILGAVLYLIMEQLLPEHLGGQWLAELMGMALVIVLRILAAHFKWNLPRVKLPQSEEGKGDAS